ncbi:MAG: ABC transporter permease [Firmicutes bacterium]|nr:ABC transporter permease [Bacillota bacterium]
MKTWIAFWNILKKDMRNYYLKPPNISWGIIFPLAWTLMQLIRAPQSFEINQLLPGLMAMSILFGSTSMLAVTITFERRGRSFDRLLLAPISLTTMVLAKTCGAILFGVFNAFIPVLFAAFFIDLAGTNWLLLSFGVLMIAVTSTLLSLVIAVSVREVFEAQTFSNFFRFPMLFLCGLFFPVSKLPLFLRPLAYCLPLTYGADLLKRALMGGGMMSIGLNSVVLLAMAGLLFVFAERCIRRKWIL